MSKKLMAEFEAHLEAIELKEHALDYIDTYQNDEIAQMVREGILTIEEVEAGLRRNMTRDGLGELCLKHSDPNCDVCEHQWFKMRYGKKVDNA